MWGSILGGIGNLAGNAAILGGAAGKGGERQYKQAVDLWERLGIPEYDMGDISWEELQNLAYQNPTTYEAITPESAQTAQDSPALALQQAQALAQARQVAEEGMPVADRLAAQEAQGRVSGAARSAQLAALRDLAERGRLGAGDEIQARLAASQQASTLGRGMAADLATQAANRRMQGIQEYGSQAAGMRQQGFQNSATNANIINNFNNLVAQMRTQAAASNAAAQTQAQAANAAQKQRVGEENVQGRTNMNLYNQQNRNQLLNQSYGNRLQKLGGLTGALTGYGDVKYDEQAARAEALRSLFGGGGKAIGGGVDIWKNS